jgi:hypothetical protein
MHPLVGSLYPHAVRHLNTVVPSHLFGTTRSIGIELELEGTQSLLKEMANKTKYWIPVEDHSLYYEGMELVSSNKAETTLHEYVIPIAGRHIDAAMKELATLMNRYAASTRRFSEVIKPIPRTSDRTSNHIHIGVLDFENKKLKDLYLNYLIFEPLLFSIVGHRREENIFCYPSRLQTKVLDRLYAWPTTDGFSKDFFANNFKKYEAFNMRAVAEKGTVEFRHRGGEYNYNAIEDWIRILLKLVEYSGPMYWELWSSMNHTRLLKYTKMVLGNTIMINHSILPVMYSAYERIKEYLVESQLKDNEIILDKFFSRVVKESSKTSVKKVAKCAV